MNYRVVLKIGSTLISADSDSCLKLISNISSQIKKILKNNVDFIIVTSGAISEGQKVMNIHDRPEELNSLQALAAIGQQQLMSVYENAFNKHDIITAQVLLTHDDMLNKDRHSNAKVTIEKLLELNVLPIINENDVVATEEIKFGDNDKLAAMVAKLINADLMIILTNQDGFFTKNPDLHSDATLIKNIAVNELRFENYNDKSKSKLGTGGFVTKLQAVKIAAESSTDTVIASGYQSDVLLKIFDNEEVGTKFICKK